MQDAKINLGVTQLSKEKTSGDVTLEYFQLFVGKKYEGDPRLSHLHLGILIIF